MMVRLAAGIADRGVHVDLVVADAQGPYVAEVPPSVALVDLGKPRTAAAVRVFAAHLRRTRPDAVLATLPHATFAAALALRLSGVPAAFVAREANTPAADASGRARVSRSPVVDLGMRWVHAMADGVIAVSEGVADGLVRFRGVARTKLATLYNPVVDEDLTVRAAIDPVHPWLAPGAFGSDEVVPDATDLEPVVLGVGSLKPSKGFLVLLEAVAMVRETRAVRLIVLGEGPQRSELERAAHDLGIADVVDLPGFEPNPFAYMARAAVYVLASEREGLPGALVQAMACGCPVVATDCRSGPREVLEDGAHGALVPVGDARAMADAISAAIAAPRRVDAVRARAARFASADVVAAHHEWIDGLVRARAARVSRGAA